MNSVLSAYFQIFFWIAVAAIAYTYAGYPLLLILISKFRAKPVARQEVTPPVTVIIAAYNEERDLARKLENTLALDYPKDKLEILVTSDCSTDRTNEIVGGFESRGVRLHRQTERLGKTAAQNAAVEKANGEILLFSDATTHYRPDVLRMLARSFVDPSVGCVTGNVIYSHDADSSVSHGTRSYWSYEFLLKKHESAITSLIGVCGCMYAVRKSAYVPLYHEACSDFLVATMMVRQGLRAVYEPEAICVEEPNARAHKELAVRVRIITQTLADLWRNRDVLNPFVKGFYAVQLLSHKVMRYLVPLFLVAVLITSALLARHSAFYAVIFIAQVCFYLASAASTLLVRLGVNSRWLALPHYFVITNVACLIALFRLLRGERYVKWEPVRERAASV
jgi:cellulose synthase/poly-beta-1,6-N-acetylglucosamine synthase-like glycosyltransferase